MTARKAQPEKTLFGPMEPPTTKAKTKTPAAPKAGKKQEIAVPVRRQSATKIIQMTNPADLLVMIERMGSNKDVDAEKVDKVISLLERIDARNAKIAFDNAMCAMQPNLPVLTKDGRIDIESKEKAGGRITKAQATPYAKWETVAPILKPVLSEYGFALTFRTGTAPDGKVRVSALLDGFGHREETYLDLPYDIGGSKNNVQAIASTVSYGKRHTAFAILNLVAQGEDDDGKASGPVLTIGQPISKEQFDQLMELKDAVGAPLDALVKHLSKTKPKGHPELTGLALLPVGRFDEAVTALRHYEAEMQKKAAAAKPAGAA